MMKMKIKYVQSSKCKLHQVLEILVEIQKCMESENETMEKQNVCAIKASFLYLFIISISLHIF